MSCSLTRTVRTQRPRIWYTLLTSGSRFLWWQLDQSHLRHQWSAHQNASRREDWRQCEAVLRGYAEIGSRQGSPRPYQSSYIPVCIGCGMVAGCLQPRLDPCFALGVRCLALLGSIGPAWLTSFVVVTASLELTAATTQNFLGWLLHML
jgi:hypothetical protein